MPDPLVVVTPTVLGGGVQPNPCGWYDVVAWGAILDGTTDNSAVINTAITTLNSLGGGLLDIPGGKTCAIASSITLKNNVVLRLQPGATIKWTGSAGGTMFTCSSTIALQRSGVVGGTIDPNGSAGIVFDLHSPQVCRFGEGMQVLNGSASTIVCKLVADATTPTDSNFGTNACFTRVRELTAGVCGELLHIQGTSGSRVVTECEFGDLYGFDVRSVGFNISRWADTNVLTGYNCVALGANNAKGIVFNSDDPTNYNGVYGWVCESLAVNTFGVLTGRVGCVLNNCKQIDIPAYYQYPVAEGGSFSISANALSYRIGYVSDTGTLTTNGIDCRFRGYNFVQVTDNDPLGVKSADATVTPELRVENTANGGGSRHRLRGLTAGGTLIGGFWQIAAAGAAQFGTESAHPIIFYANNTEIFRIDSSYLTMADGKPIVLGSTSGTQIGTATTQKLGFFAASPIVQPAGTGETVGFTAGAGTAAKDDSTFTGNVGTKAYRISDIVKALKNLGLIAAS